MVVGNFFDYWPGTHAVALARERLTRVCEYADVWVVRGK